MEENTILIVSNILSNMRKLYYVKIILEHREKEGDYIIKCKDNAVFKSIFDVLSSLDSHTLNFYLEDKETFVIF